MRLLFAALLAASFLLAGCIKDAAPSVDDAAGGGLQSAAVEDAPPASEPAPASEPTPASPAPAPAPSPAPSPQPQGEPEAEPQPAPKVTVQTWEGSATGGGLGSAQPAPGLFVGTVQGEGTSGTFAISPGTVGLVLELVWTDEAMDLDLALRGPDSGMAPPSDPTAPSFDAGHVYASDGGAPGQPDGHAFIVVTDPEALALEGEWTWEVASKGSVEAPFTVYLSLFEGAPPAEGYSAAQSEKP